MPCQSFSVNVINLNTAPATDAQAAAVQSEEHEGEFDHEDEDDDDDGEHDNNINYALSQRLSDLERRTEDLLRVADMPDDEEEVDTEAGLLSNVHQQVSCGLSSALLYDCLTALLYHLHQHALLLIRCHCVCRCHMLHAGPIVY